MIAMFTMKVLARIVALGVAILGLSQPVIAQPSYTIQRIQALSGNSVVRIGDAGHIVASHYVWYNGSVTDVGGLGGNFTAVEDVNVNGQVVGRSRDSSGIMHAFVWQDGIMTPLPTLGGQDGFATAINNFGEIVGYTDNSPGPSVVNHRATFWTSSHLAVDIGTIPPDHSSRAYAINNLGQAAGISLPSTGSAFGADAFFWNGTLPTAFIQNIDPFDFDVKGLNDASHVVGRLNSTAYVWQNGTMSYLGTLGGSYSRANSINNAGQIVGQSTTSSGAARAMIYEGGQMLDLNTLVTNMSEWQYLGSAIDINNSGQIVGLGRLHGGFSDSEVFLLTPVHEPPVIVEASANPAILWPPNNKMVTVNATALVQADSERANWRIVDVECNEPLTGNFELVDDHTVRLRAARTGHAADRTYTLWLLASDAFGNDSEPKSVTVNVPHDRRGSVP